MKFNKNVIEFMINNKIEALGKKYGSEAKASVIEILSLEKNLRPDNKENRLIPLPQWNKYYDYPSLAGMRMKVYRAAANGFNEYGVVHKKGRVVFINEQAYLRWLNHNEQSKLLE